MSYYDFERLTNKPVIHGIYCIYCRSTDTSYIGKHQDIYHRFEEHKRDLKSGKHYNKKLQADFNKYGIENFKFFIIETVDDWEMLTKDELLVELAYREWYHIFDVYLTGGKKLYNEVGLREQALWYTMKKLQQFGNEIKFVRRDIEGKFYGGTKLDFTYLDKKGNLCCRGCFDLNNSQSRSTYEKHKRYCENKNIKFKNLDPNQIFGLYGSGQVEFKFDTFIDEKSLNLLTSTMG